MNPPRSSPGLPARGIEYLVFHPWKVTSVLVIGAVLGLGGFYAYQVQAAFAEVAVEDFNPAQARHLIERSRAPIASAVFEEPADGAPVVDFSSEAADIRELLDVLGTFDPREVNPNAFGEPIPDEVFEAYLLIGTDASGFLADAIVLALQPNDSSRPIVVSLPRDLYLWNTCRETFTRLNAGLGGCSGVASGMEMMALMVEDYTGIPVDHMARINFSGFAAAVDALGGTTICVDHPTRDPKAGLSIPTAGCQHADGDLTLAWVRSRSTEQLIDGEWRRVAGSDYVRQNRQQDILFQLADRAASFSSPGNLVSRLSAVAGSVRLDSSWTLGDAVWVGWRYRGISKGSVSRFSIDADNYRTPGGAQVLIPSVSFQAQLSEVYELD